MQQDNGLKRGQKHKEANGVRSCNPTFRGAGGCDKPRWVSSQLNALLEVHLVGAYL